MRSSLQVAWFIYLSIPATLSRSSFAQRILSEKPKATENSGLWLELKAYHCLIFVFWQRFKLLFGAVDVEAICVAIDPFQNLDFLKTYSNRLFT